MGSAHSLSEKSNLLRNIVFALNTGLLACKAYLRRQALSEGIAGAGALDRGNSPVFMPHFLFKLYFFRYSFEKTELEKESFHHVRIQKPVRSGSR